MGSIFVRLLCTYYFTLKLYITVIIVILAAAIVFGNVNIKLHLISKRVFVLRRVYLVHQH